MMNMQKASAFIFIFCLQFYDKFHIFTFIINYSIYINHNYYETIGWSLLSMRAWIRVSSRQEKQKNEVVGSRFCIPSTPRGTDTHTDKNSPKMPSSRTHSERDPGSLRGVDLHFCTKRSASRFSRQYLSMSVCVSPAQIVHRLIYNEILRYESSWLCEPSSHIST